MSNEDELTLEIESEDFSCDGLRVRTFSGKEAIGHLFDYELEVVGPHDSGADPDAMLGAHVTLVLQRAEGRGGSWHGTRHLHGVVTEVDDLLAAHATLRVHRLRVRPRAHALGLVEAQDIFMGLTVPQIIEQKLKLVGLEKGYELRLSGQYAPREFVVQYAETDLAFVSRLCEHLGISFFVEQREAGDTLVFTDHPAGFTENPDAASLPFAPRGESRDVFALSSRRRLIPAYYVVRDYNYRTPLLDLTSEHELPAGYAGGVFEMGTHHKTPAEGKALAAIRADERESKQLVYTGESASPTLAAGTRFELTDHPDLGNVRLLVVEVEHRAEVIVDGHSAQRPGYRSTFVAIPAERAYRPARVTPRPRISGVVTGIIDGGPAGNAAKYAQVDAEGRYMVRFSFDTAPPGERPASRPVRMLQNHAGEGYGTHFPLKPGVEVAIAFVGGDPDRPMIVGAIPNPIKPSPVTNEDPGLHRVRTSTGITVDMHE